MVRTDKSLSGIHLLCAVGRYQEACSQVWSYLFDLLLATPLLYCQIATAILIFAFKLGFYDRHMFHIDNSHILFCMFNMDIFIPQSCKHVFML